MFSSHTPVQVNNPDLERHGQAGRTVGQDDADPAFTLVRFDSDGETESVANADLKAL